jgi:probable FeS assembly SUF system protein SufT
LYIGYVPGKMTVSNSVNLTREVTATAIPAGTAKVIAEGAEVYITQELGGSFTIHAAGLLYRIEGKDADALRREVTGEEASQEEPTTTLEDETVWEKLRTCFDPEIPVNIVDLGLIYDLTKQSLPSGKFKVFVKMTLTAPGCGMGDVIANDARQKILTIPSVDDALVEIVWDPPWHQSMITEQGRIALGLE